MSERITNNILKQINIKSSLCILFGSVVGCLTGIVLTLSLITVFKNPLRLFLNDYILTASVGNQLSPIHRIVVDDLISKNQIVSANDIISHISDFYSALITFLGILLTVSVLIGYLYILVLTKRQIEEHTEIYLKSYTKTNEFNKGLSVMVQPHVEAHVDKYIEGADVEAINNKMAKLENQIEQIRNSNSFEPNDTELIDKANVIGNSEVADTPVVVEESESVPENEGK